MWMARGQQETRLQEPGAEWGEVTLSGDTVGVSLAGERGGFGSVCRAGITGFLTGERRCWW